MAPIRVHRVEARVKHDPHLWEAFLDLATTAIEHDDAPEGIEFFNWIQGDYEVVVRYARAGNGRSWDEDDAEALPFSGIPMDTITASLKGTTILRHPEAGLQRMGYWIGWNRRERLAVVGMKEPEPW
jgi:hypothetical protein